MRKQNSKFLMLGGGVLLVIAFFFFYRTICPLEKTLGIPCPGCNMTTALYYLVQGKMGLALYFHPLVIVLVVALIAEALLYIKYQNFSNRYSKIILIVFFTLLVVVYMYRMITIYPNAPMVYNPNNYIEKIKALF